MKFTVRYCIAALFSAVLLVGLNLILDYLTEPVYDNTHIWDLIIWNTFYFFGFYWAVYTFQIIMHDLAAQNSGLIYNIGNLAVTGIRISAGVLVVFTAVSIITKTLLISELLLSATAFLAMWTIKRTCASSSSYFSLSYAKLQNRLTYKEK